MTSSLSASSLLLAAFALVYSQWYPEITSTLRRNEGAKDKNSLDREPEFLEVRQVFHYRTLPLLITALLLASVLLPDAVETTISSMQLFIQRGPQALRNYDTVSTAYVLSVVLWIAFCVHLSQLAYEARQLKKALRPETRS